METLNTRLAQLTLRDERRLRRRLDKSGPESITSDLETAELKAALRRESVPKINYPEELPISQRREDIAAAIRDHQVVIVAGETGSGKTTQLPKICLELGRGVRGLIGHTQPRRLAARTVADRIAEELGKPLGSTVGFKVRFTDKSSDDTLVKLMTDGILLAEIQQDRSLYQYDTLIIDEAHERSLNIDFLLGYLKQLLPRRPDLKVIITSATIDPERFAKHFSDAPIVEVSGRTYPVEVRYRPIFDDEAEETASDKDQVTAIVDAVDELRAEGPGDILVFLSGEREIRDTADALERHRTQQGFPLDVLPLYARLSYAEQHRVFQPHGGRRVVLATNVAETSLTVPGIKYVIDPGTARISRYSNRLKVQRLPIEAVSQASANQRKGRCGRTSDGICIRLYSENDFLARSEFTDPEILRTNLASVILQMTSLGLGDMAAFPFVDPPDRRNINDGIALLEELGALAQDSGPEKRLTAMGRKLAQLPVDPRLARMVVEAQQAGCVHEVMVITAALSIQDPRERPSDQQAQADQQHARFVDKESDFMGLLNLWRYLREQQKALTSNQFRRMCRNEYLNYLRVREWQDIYSQLREVMRQLGATVENNPEDSPAAGDVVHRALLAGLLSHIGFKDPANPPDYLGARGAKFGIFPGSALFRKTPRWLMSAELVETSRLWARMNAKIEPEWAEELAPHLVKRQYNEPHWERKVSAVVAYEKVTLYGLPIIASRKINFGKIDPELCRALFIRHALVERDWPSNHKFLEHNERLRKEVEELEEKVRRRDLVVDDQTLYEFYDARVGKDVVSGAHFDRWWRDERKTSPQLLDFDRQLLLNENAKDVSEQAYPSQWRSETPGMDSTSLKLDYKFEPGTQRDGVSVVIPLAGLNQVKAEQFSWQVPGLRQELVTALLKSLRKTIRRYFVPVPDYVTAVLARMTNTEEPLLDALERELAALTGVQVARDDWRWDHVPEHLKITFQVQDNSGKIVAEGKDLEELRERLKPKVRETISTAAKDVQKTGLTTWDFGTLDKVVQRTHAGHRVTGYPALVDEGATVAIRVLDTAAAQQDLMWRGTRRLLLLNTPSPVKLVQRKLANEAKLVLSRNPHGGVPALLADCVDCAMDKIISDCGGPAWNQAGFDRILTHAKSQLGQATLIVLDQVRAALAAWHIAERKLDTVTAPVFKAAVADMTAQLKALIGPGFATATGYAQLGQLPRYVKGIEHRLDKLPEKFDRDEQWMHQVQDIDAEYRDLVKALPPGRQPGPELRAIRWMIEELRISYFAQPLGTAYPISEKRIFTAIDKLPG
ncbi:ATP-dependent RNA helicase HrpA [Pseudonocardiaceae bacterium YIM PH 21723]|nr:ATP-dependent RNA helicase HrpA [Pseudonocardiaceae bacterium YIM PH 21723]